MSRYDIEPSIEGNVQIGMGGNQDSILVGKIAEWGKPRYVWFDITKEFVAMVIGQRGSGKSFCLGSILEGFCTKNKETTISKRQSDRATLLLDPTGNFWTTALPLKSSGSERVLNQFKLLEGWPIELEDINCKIWLPAGYRLSTDNPSIQEFFFDTTDFEVQDWADILGINIMSDPQGMLLSDVYYKASVEGWDCNTGIIQPKDNPNLTDLIDCLENEITFQDGTAGFAIQTVRTLTRNLKTFARQPVFSGGATKMTELLESGQLSVMMMPFHIDKSLRSVLSRVLIRKILRDRFIASQIQNRLEFEELDGSEITNLQSELKKHIPRTVVALDEAQELLGDRGGIERSAIEDFCLVGRNFGLSMIIATQRPETNAISAKVRDQAGIWFIHNLGSQSNINTVQNNFIAPFSPSVSDGHRELGFSELLRSLQTGEALVASKKMDCKNNVYRAFVMQVRPRLRIHGGEAS